MRLFAAAVTFAGLLSMMPARLVSAEVVAPHPQLEQIHKVYLLSMGGGLEQYLAQQLTAKGVLEVVTDPKLADAVFSENIGPDFEARLKDLLPPPTPEPVVEVKDTKKAKGKDKDEESGTSYVVSPVQRTSSFARGRGNLFLVDLKTRSVVWSTHSVPKYRTADEYDRTSARMAEALAKDLNRK
jgi:hypothetical protein